MADIRDGSGKVIARREGDKILDIYGNRKYTIVGDRVMDTYGNWKYSVRGEYLYDIYGNRVKDLTKPL